MNKKYRSIYTDGACEPNPGHGGWGFVILSPPDHIKGWGGELETTNNRMELMGAIKGLEYFDTPQCIRLWSDSRYLVNGLNKWLDTWTSQNRLHKMANSDLWQILWDLKTFHKIDAIWIKGHNDNKFNDLADELSFYGMEETISLAVDNMALY